MFDTLTTCSYCTGTTTEESVISGISHRIVKPRLPPKEIAAALSGSHITTDGGAQADVAERVDARCIAPGIDSSEDESFEVALVVDLLQ